MRSILPRSVLAALVAFAFAAGAFAQSSDVFVTKTGPATANPGDNVTFTITVGNGGTDPAPNATLTDTLPSGSTFVSESQTNGPTFGCTTPTVGTFGGTVTCTIASFAVGASATFQVVVNAPVGSGGTTLINSATISSDNPDPNTENNSSIAGTLISGGNLADVGVTKTGPQNAVPGSNVTFTITVADFGPNDASSVTLNDTLGAGLTFVSLTQTSGPTFSCPGNTTPCTIATLPNGSSATFNLVATASSTPGTYTNTASVTSANDPNPENDSADAAVVVGTSDLGVTKSGPATAIAGQNVTYNITVANSGPDNAINPGFNDTLPPGTTFVSVVQNSGPSASCQSSGSTISCRTGLLLNGQSDSFTLTAFINPNVPNGTILSNTATTVQDDTDPNPNNNSSTALTTVAATSDLSIAKSGPASVIAGTNMTYTINVTNAGPSDAVSVQWVDVLPPGTTFVSETQTSGPTFTCSTGGTITCSIATLAAGATASFTVVVHVSSAATGSISNTATINSSTSDGNPSNNSSTATTNVTTSADVAVTKSASPSPVPGGSNLTYTITVTNNGPSDAASVSLSDTLPANTTFVSMTQTSGPTFSCSGTSTVTCTIASLVSGATASFQLIVHVSAATVVGSTISNTATVTSATPDSNPGNNSATATTMTTGADVAVTKSASPSPVPAGSNLTYTITVMNNGPSAAASVSLSDTVPTNTTFVSMTQTSGPTFSCSGTSTQTCTIASLPSGASASFQLVVQVSASAVVGSTISNTATVTSATSDSNAGNNSATTTTTVAPPLSDLSVTKTASPPSSVYPVGINVTFTIMASNGGPNTASNVVVTDTLPSTMTFVSANSTQGTCSGSATVTCTIGTLASGATATITIVAQTTSQGSSTNTATITSSSTDPNPANNTASVTFFVSNNVPTLSPLLLALLALAFAAIATRLLTE